MSGNHFGYQPSAKPMKPAQRKPRKNLLSHTGTRLERSVSDLGTSDHLYNDHLDSENFHFAAFLDSHSLHDGLGLGFKPEVKNRSLSWQHSGSSAKSTLKAKNTERKSLKTGMKHESNGSHLNLSSSPGLLISSNSSSPFSDSPLGHGGLDNLFNQPIKKKRTSKGAKFRMFTRVWVPAFKVAGCITQEKNGGWKYVQFDNGLPISSATSAASVPSPRAMSKGLVDGKWCRACDMEEFQEGVNGQHVPNATSESHHFPSNQSFCDNDSDAEFDGNLLGIADSFGMISGNGLQFFSQNSNHSDLGSDDDFGNLPMSATAANPRDIRLAANGPHDATSLLTDDLDQLDSFLMKRRRDRSDSLDLMNANLSHLNERDVFMTLGMNTKLEDSMAGKIAPTSIGGAGVLDDVAWHNIEYSGISLDDCDWNL
jgi:hypothetical protein